MGNMKFANSSGTYTFTDNPSGYSQEEVSIETNERLQNAGLLNYNKGIYNIFVLSFDNIGTAQMANFGTFFRAKQTITFYPFDENKGTAKTYNVRWLGNFNFNLDDSYWAHGYAGSISLEEI